MSLNPPSMDFETIPPTAYPRLLPSARIQWDSIREKHILLSPEGILILNQTAAAILNLCDGQHNISEIVAELTKQYQKEVEQDILTFLIRLASKRMIRFDGQSHE